MTTRAFNQQTVRGLFLDVRGTLLPPYDDVEMPSELAVEICNHLRRGRVLALITATSLATLERLVLPSLRHPATWKDRAAPVLLYVDSGTLAYEVTTSESIVELPAYPFLTFETETLRVVLDVVQKAAQRVARESTWKTKPGQVNFYVGGSWTERASIAADMRGALSDAGHENVHVMVPTSKDTIDIALCTKGRAVTDALQRTGVAGDEILMIGDSFQFGAPDLDMLIAIPEATAVQVGPFDVDASIIRGSKDGPIGSLEILKRT